MPIAKEGTGSQAVRAFRAEQASIFYWKLRETKPSPIDPIGNSVVRSAKRAPTNGSPTTHRGWLLFFIRFNYIKNHFDQSFISSRKLPLTVNSF